MQPRGRGDAELGSPGPDVVTFAAAMDYMLLQRLPRGPLPTSSSSRDQARCARRPCCHQAGGERTFKQTRRPPCKPRGRLGFESKLTSVVSPPANQPREAQPGSIGVHCAENGGRGRKRVDTCPSCKHRTGPSTRADMPTTPLGHKHDVTGRTAASLHLPCHTVFTGRLASTHSLVSRLPPARRRCAAGASRLGTGPDVTASDSGARPAWGRGGPGGHVRATVGHPRTRLPPAGG